MAGKKAQIFEVETVNVKSMEWLDDDRQGACLEVKAKHKNSNREYVVHFDKKGRLRYAYQYVPEEGYLEPEQVPSAVVSAAVKAYHERP